MTVDPLTPLEAAVGMPLGGGPPVRLAAAGAMDPREALEEATRAALTDGPCTVAFSGGRDSSLVLAAATAMARRAGLPEPIALTFRFPAVPTAQEDRWQERVIAHLRLRRWERVDLADELDLLGPAATGLLKRVGPYWPANSHFAWLLARLAAPGVLLTGEGGDELFAWWRWARAATVLGRGAPRGLRDVPTVALALAPPTVRRWHDRRLVERLSWLTAAGWVEYRDAVAAWADVPWRWDRQLAWMRARDDVTLSLSTLARVGADAGARIGAPLLDTRVLAALAGAGGRYGLGGRRTTLQSAFAGLLPDDVLARSDKARFNAAFWGPLARRFATEWTGEGVDERLVESEALRAAWLSPGGDWRSADLLHRAWLKDAWRQAE